MPGKCRSATATFAESKQHLMFGNEIALRPDGSVAAIHADGITLSADTHWLYYRPLRATTEDVP